MNDATFEALLPDGTRLALPTTEELRAAAEDERFGTDVPWFDALLAVGPVLDEVLCAAPARYLGADEAWVEAADWWVQRVYFPRSKAEALWAAWGYNAEDLAED